MNGYKFDKSEVDFYSTVHKRIPFGIDITITYQDFREENSAEMTNEIYLILEKSLGDLN